MKIFLLVMFLMCVRANASDRRDQDFGCEGPEGSAALEVCVMQGQIAILKGKVATAQARQRRASAPAAMLVAAQLAWVTYANENCRLDQSVWGGNHDVNYLRCEAWMLEERLAYLNNIARIARATRYIPGPSMHSGEVPPAGSGRLPTLSSLAQQLDAENRKALRYIDDASMLSRTHAAWQQFRRATCAVERTRYGSAPGGEKDLCMRRVTAERVTFLQTSF